MRRPGHGLGERARDLAQPGVVRDDRQRAAGGGLGRDHPERLGERARDRHRLGGGQQVRQLGVIEPAGEGDAVEPAAARGRRRVLSAEERRELWQLATVLGARSRARRPGRPPRARPRAPPGLPGTPPNPTISSRARGSRASTSGNAASSSSTPLEAISLPTNTTSRSPSGPIVSSAAHRLADVAGEGGARRARRRARGEPRRARRLAAPRPAPPPARAARSGRRRRPAGRGGCAPRSAGSSISAHRLSAVWREPTSTPRAPARPSTAYGRKRGYGLTVYSSALPWILTAYGTEPSSARARIAGPITRWFASATSGRTSSTTSRTAATFAST